MDNGVFGLTRHLVVRVVMVESKQAEGNVTTQLQQIWEIIVREMPGLTTRNATARNAQVMGNFKIKLDHFETHFFQR